MIVNYMEENVRSYLNNILKTKSAYVNTCTCKHGPFS